MKKTCLTLIAVASSFIIVNAQNTFPSSGNVGIGTTNPSTSLDVNSPNNGYVLHLASSQNYAFAMITSTSGTNLFGAEANGAWIGPNSNTALNFKTNDVIRATITNTGNLGIGVTNPAYPLHIVTQGSTSVINLQNNNNTIETQIQFTGTSHTFSTGVGNGGENQWGVANSWYIFDGTNNAMRMVINSSGNVGIGTTNPGSYSLAVNGGIHAKSVNVDLQNWSDYVFNKYYHLRSLKEVKAYIGQNQHLPDMPSEYEMIKNGLDVAGMNKLLTKKVEELTLYLIEKDKEVKELQQEVDALNKKLDKIVDTIAKDK